MPDYASHPAVALKNLRSLTPADPVLLRMSQIGKQPKVALTADRNFQDKVLTS
jgi:hypothetical protein